jgi:hypothetical protein
LQPTFRLVFNRFINDLSVKPYLTVEPEIELSTYWEDGNVLLVRPSVPLEAKTLYSFRISKDMKPMDGSEMASDYSWTFKTRELVKSLTHQMLEDGREVVTLSLNYALDPASLEWTMTPQVPGELSWSESNTILTFTSQNGLLADSRFMIDLGQSLRQQNGLPSPLAESLSIYTDKLVGFKEPASASENNPYVTLRIPFRRSVDQAVVEAGLTIEPAPRNDLVYEWDENTLLAELFLMPDTRLVGGQDHALHRFCAGAHRLPQRDAGSTDQSDEKWKGQLEGEPRRKHRREPESQCTGSSQLQQTYEIEPHQHKDAQQRTQTRDHRLRPPVLSSAAQARGHPTRTTANLARLARYVAVS